MTDHYEDLTNTAAYLSEHAKSGFTKMPEKTIAKVLNKAPPSVREAIAVQYKGLELLNDSGGRLAPFQEKRYDHYDSLPATMKTQHRPLTHRGTHHWPDGPHGPRTTRTTRQPSRLSGSGI